MAVSLTVALPGGKKGGGEVFLQTASAAGSDPFTPSTVTQDKDAAASSASPGTSSEGGTGTLVVNGSHPGLYGGTENVASCDVEKQVKFLTQNGDKGQAFAGALNIRQPEIPQYLGSLTPTRLVWDTRVTNHGYRNGAATSYQAILQAGTAVLVDDRGVPRVRCACGNPLTPPVAGENKQKYTGRQWSSFQPSHLVAVTPANKPMKTVMMFDQERKGWFQRPSGDLLGKSDARVPAPKGRPAGTPFPVLPPPESTEKHQNKEEEYPEKGEQKDKDSKKDEPKDQPNQDEPKGHPKDEPKDQQKDQPNQDQHKDQPNQDQHKDQPNQDEPNQDPHKDQPNQDQPKDEPKDQQKDQPNQDQHKDQPKDQHKDQPKDQQKDQPNQDQLNQDQHKDQHNQDHTGAG
ncbi:DUF6777 domain-containing protein [Streptomyces sp. NPDC048479]|uniref:DUF6777 domain-containing protein n=1 Tax=Streptomyces sp. NPDC048479 TaxID=3154725 RepID=UPI0034210698